MSFKKWKNTSVSQLIADSQNADPIDEIINRSKNLIEEAMKNGWEGPPFNPFRLAELLEINVVPNEAINEARIIVNKEKNYQIEYNPYQRIQRTNFSIFHEIVHTFFPDCGEKIRNRESKSADIWELEMLCDIGAAELLLPTPYFKRDANEIELTMENLVQLANKYNASLESVFLRFTEVTEQPCAMCIAFFDESENNNLSVVYSKASERFDYTIPKDYIIPKFSKAYECVNPGWTSQKVEQWQLFNNENHFIYSIGLGSPKNVNGTRVGILIAPIPQGIYTPETINFIKGDATQPRGDRIKIIAQVVNTSLGLGTGFGKSMATRYPRTTKILKEWQADKHSFILGNSKLTQLTDDIYVYHMLAQDGIFPKAGKIPLRYESLAKCLNTLAVIALDLEATVHMPLIGAGQAGGDWNSIQEIIHKELVGKNIEVNVYTLPKAKLPIKSKINLTLFNEE